MKPYRSVFKESQREIDFISPKEVKKIVDISNLVWSKSFKASFKVAQSKCPPGWRLPTIEELYTACVQSVPGFEQGKYWSSTSYSKNLKEAWGVDFFAEDVFIDDKSYDGYYVRFTKNK